MTSETTTTASPTERRRETVLVFDDVSRTFPDGTFALASTSLDVARGEFVTVVGPSGCGKSTLLRIASGLDQPSTGAVTVDHSSLGYVFQDATLLPWRDVRRNVELFAELEGMGKADSARRVAENVKLVGLDEITRERLNDELLGLFQRKGFGALFITHSISEAVFLSTRVLVMSQRPGRILESIEVPFAYPRHHDLRFEPAFAELSGEVSHALRGAHA